ncbi:hypothetical protein M9980_01205 [Sphingomonas donggukensis]|uniref:Uncharacterized protein n=1 Tax=Sphingomonas donggukensis TaxID=2949093 RepID=A0ABY4TU10_9SPHN|nr:hypothetical protein [Sphingomonas donggukensis]URW75881.1 hypothetical protein M9980_01205 [Sphingomonas donggukensis]
MRPLRGDVQRGPGLPGACRAGMRLAPKTGANEMSLQQAQRRAWNLARTLMVEILIIQFDDRRFGVLEAAEFDGDPQAIITTYDPFAA